MTQQPQYIDPTDAMFGAGASLSFADVSQKGQWRGGTIVAPPSTSQRTNFQTKAPEFWPDGQPKMQIVVKLQTAERDPSNPADSGQRSLFIKGGVHSAVSAALAAAGAPGLRVGAELYVRWVGEKASAQGSPAKVYEAVYRLPDPNAPVPVAAAPAQQQQPAPSYGPPAGHPVQQPAPQAPPVYQAPQQVPPTQPQQPAAAPWPPQAPPAQTGPPVAPQQPAAPWPPAAPQSPQQEAPPAWVTQGPPAQQQNPYG
jgi:hypothetical protein